MDTHIQCCRLIHVPSSVKSSTVRQSCLNDRTKPRFEILGQINCCCCLHDDNLRNLCPRLCATIGGLCATICGTHATISVGQSLRRAHLSTFCGQRSTNRGKQSTNHGIRSNSSARIKLDYFCSNSSWYLHASFK